MNRANYHYVLGGLVSETRYDDAHTRLMINSHDFDAYKLVRANPLNVFL